VRRPGPQTLAAIGALVLLALVAVVTARAPAPPAPSFASTDYRAAGYRAWTALLAREGVSTERFVLRPIELDAGIDTLISALPPPAQRDPAARTAADIGALAAWVRRGGKLVYLGRDSALRDAENRLLQLPILLPDVGPRGRFTGPWSGPVQSLHGLGKNRMRLVEHAGSALLADGSGDVVVRYPLGRGEIAAVIDPLPFTNGEIGRADNARLAFLVATPRRANGVVAFDDGLHGALIDRPWYRALPLPVRVTLAIAGVALVLGLVGSALGGGPPMALEAAREPTSVEFVEALAALYERTGARDAARGTLARAALAAAARSAGVADDTAPDVLAAYVGERRGGTDLRRLVAALATPVRGDSDLLAGAKLAQVVRKEFTDGGNGNDGRTAFAGRPRKGRRWE
jgi:hypothetical protein